MTRDRIIGEVSVCTDCMLTHANGETDPDRPADQPEPWALIGNGFDVTMGGDHADDCPNGLIDGPADTDCDCDSLGFSWSPCEGCGSNLSGDRFKFTLWERVTTDSHAVGDKS